MNALAERGWTQWSPAQTTAMCERYGDGLKFRDIADELGFTKNALVGRYNRLIAESSGHLIHDSFTQMLADGWSLQAIADEAQISIGAVEARLADLRRRLGPQAR